MAFDPRELAILAYANGFTLWHYATKDPMPAVRETGYFDAAADHVQPGDMILATTNGAGAVLVVTSKSSVAVAPLAA